MESITLRLLKKLAKHRELSIRDCTALLPKKTNDHLDFYPLANLIKHGFANLDINTNGKPLCEETEMEIATSLFIWAAHKGGEFRYQDMDIQGADLGNEKVFATARGYFALDEMRSKRTERLWALAVGIVIAIVAANLKGMLTA